jgi:DNA-binding MarR family transcriptional regulator
VSPIRDEIKQQRPFRSRGQEGVVSLLRTADQLKRDFASLVEPHGLTLQQFNVLRILRGAGPKGLPTLDIAERMIEQAPGITRLLDRLEKKALVRRERCPEDRRQVLVAITPGGLRLLADLDGPVAEADDALLARLGSRRTIALIRLLDAVRNPKPARRSGSLCSSKEKKA